MTVSGDLATIDLADLLQNIEVHSRTGVLSLSFEDTSAKIFFREGHVAMLAGDGRTPFVEMLVASGHLTQKKLEAARKKVKGTRRCVVELLVSARVLSLEDLRALAADFLTEDVANLVAAAKGEFQFTESDRPGPGFDPDEASLLVSLAVAPLILEATRRVDHWVEIRKFLPSDSMHFQVREGARLRENVEDPELAQQVLDALDGSRSVKEVTDLCPNRRFLAYKMLGDFVRDRVARPTGVEDLLALAAAIERVQPQRARQLVRRGLDFEPHQLDLLAAEARLAEVLGDQTAAAAAHKLMAHVHLEAEHGDEALAAFEAGKRLAPTDPSLWERTLALALTQGRHEDARRDGMQLVAMYRAPGLHNRAKEVLERLLRLDPEAVDLHVEFARSCVDCGEPQVASKHLTRRGKILIGKQDYLGARSLYEEILDIEPGNREASVSIEMIDKEIFVRRRERKRRLIRLVLTACTVTIVGLFVCTELAARLACIETRTLISQERMIEQRQYQDAIVLWNGVRDRHRLALTTWLDVPRQIADLQERLQEISMLQMGEGK
ncbi:MAG: DUF4388 domain-containing protein [Planctomycetota bacterium]